MSLSHWDSHYQAELQQYSQLEYQVSLQIEKDFMLEGLAFQADENATFATIYNQLYPLVKQFIETQFTTLTRLLYRIDISENKVANHMQKEPDSAKAISQLILKREIEKVILKKQYSAK